MSTLLQTKVDERCKLLIKGGRTRINELAQISDKKVLNDIRQVIDSLILQIENIFKLPPMS
jgi:hypothetical protein